jgi:predicted RNA-binding protein with RPS1 domain
MQNVMKIRPLGANLFLPEGQTGMTKVIVVFRNFAKKLNKNKKIHALSGIRIHNLSYQVTSDLRINRSIRYVNSIPHYLNS